MSLYPPADEHRIRLQGLVRAWTKSNLLDPAQGAALDAELRVNLRRTNAVLRAALALFATLIVAASVAFVIVVFDLDRPIPAAVVSTGAAAVCLGLAHYFVLRQRFYRFGVEEALAVTSVILLAAGAGVLTGQYTDGRSVEHVDAPAFAAWLVGAAGGLALYWRFGYVYTAIGGIACGAAVPFQLGISAPAQHVLAATVLTAAFLIARRRHARFGDEYPGDDYALLQAAALAGVYLTLNLQLRPWWTPVAVGRPFYWFTYAMIWALPVAGLWLALRGKDRALLAVSLAMTLVTTLTNKPYLGWPRHEWDPMLLGVFLMAAAIIARRWLSAGANGQRGGFTAARMLSTQSGAVTLVGMIFRRPSSERAVVSDVRGLCRRRWRLRRRRRQRDHIERQSRLVRATALRSRSWPRRAKRSGPFSAGWRTISASSC